MQEGALVTRKPPTQTVLFTYLVHNIPLYIRVPRVPLYIKVRRVPLYIRIHRVPTYTVRQTLQTLMYCKGEL